MLALLLVLLPLPAGAWYKHGASSRYHTVGRAAGLLVGLRRSPYVRRRALRPAAAGPPAWATLGLGAPSRELSTRDTSLRGPAPVMPPCFPPSFRDCARRDAGAPAQGSPSVRLRERVPDPCPHPSRGWQSIPGPRRSRPEPPESTPLSHGLRSELPRQAPASPHGRLEHSPCLPRPRA